MKKTYTACLILLSAGILYYGNLTGTGSQQCPRKDRLAGLNNNPTNCAGSCHGTVLNQDTIQKDTLGGTGNNGNTGGSNTNGGTTGINDVHFAQGLAVYPTLTSDVVHIESSTDTKDMTFAVYSLDGREVMTGQLPVYAAIVTVNMQSLPASHYVVRVTDGAHAANFRVVKN